MKSYMSTHVYRVFLSPPSRGAWIEIDICREFHVNEASPPSRGAWIEITWATA